MFERYYSFFHCCMLSCRYVMFRKRFLSKPKWGAKAAFRGPRPPGATALGTGLGYRYQIGVLVSQICTARQLPVSAGNLLQVPVYCD